MSYYDIDETIEDAMAAVIQQQAPSLTGRYTLVKCGSMETVTAPRLEVMVSGYEHELLGDYYVSGNVWADVVVALVVDAHDSTREEFRRDCGSLSAFWRSNDVVDLINNSGAAVIKVMTDGWRPGTVERQVSETEYRKEFNARLYCCTTHSQVGP